MVKTSALQQDPSLVGSQHTPQVASNCNLSGFRAHRHSNAHAYKQTHNEKQKPKTKKQPKTKPKNKKTKQAYSYSKKLLHESVTIAYDGYTSWEVSCEVVLCTVGTES